MRYSLKTVAVNICYIVSVALLNEKDEKYHMCRVRIDPPIIPGKANYNFHCQDMQWLVQAERDSGELFEAEVYDLLLMHRNRRVPTMFPLVGWAYM